MKESGKYSTSVIHSNIVRKVSLLNWLLLFVLFPRNLEYHLSDGADEISTSFFSSKLTEPENKACWLRSWVQIHPPGPLFPVMKLRRCSDLLFDSCRTNISNPSMSLKCQRIYKCRHCALLPPSLSIFCFQKQFQFIFIPMQGPTNR